MIAEEMSLIRVCIGSWPSTNKTTVDMASQPPDYLRFVRTQNHPKEDAMPTSRFIQRFQDKITGVLSGFDRLVIRGTLRRIVSVAGLKDLLWHKQILLKQFGGWADRFSEQLKEACCRVAKDH